MVKIKFYSPVLIVWCSSSTKEVEIGRCLLFSRPAAFCHAHPTHHTECSYFPCAHAALLFSYWQWEQMCLGLDWKTGAAELPRQTVILRQTPVHPSPSLHLSDLEHCFRRPPSPLPPSPSFLCSLRERTIMLPSSLLPFQRFCPQKYVHMVAVWVWWQGGATPTDSKCLWKLRRWKAFYHYPAKTQGQIFLTLLHSCFGPTSHAVSGVQSRAIKGTSHGKKEAFSVIQYFYSVLCWVTTSNFLGCECAPNVRSFNLLALALRLILAFIQFHVSAYIVSPVHLDQRWNKGLPYRASSLVTFREHRPICSCRK